ncbi:MAG TPA: GNAT family N-acetyltransferase [Planctomycetaceae bacterium]|nr:GNAT family N-acetyltransferase [Planctomycetaceae bacterium]
MQVTARTARLSELPTLRRFEQGIVAAERPFDPTLLPDPIAYHDFESLMDSPDAEVAVAEIARTEKAKAKTAGVKTAKADSVLVGCGFAVKKASRHYTEPSFHAHFGCMFVEPEFRGKGVNQAILRHLVSWAKSMGLLETRLTVYPENAAAVRAYEKAGFAAHLLEMRMRIPE